MSVSDSVEVAAPAVEIWAAVADPSQMKRWSPENTGAPIGADRGPLAIGDSFHGTNKRGPARWITRCEVIASESGRRFAFDVHAIGLRNPRLKYPIARWDYTFDDIDGGTRVTETWTDRRPGWPDWTARMFDKVATGTTFAQFQRGNIARTLKKLKADFES